MTSQARPAAGPLIGSGPHIKTGTERTLLGIMRKQHARTGIRVRWTPDYEQLDCLRSSGRTITALCPGRKSSQGAAKRRGLAMHIMLSEIDVQLAADVASQPAAWRVAVHGEYRCAG